VLLDYHLGAGTALDAIPLLLAQAPARIVVLTALAADQVLVECLRAGAVGFVSKEQSISDVVAAVRAAHAGSLAVTPDALTAAIIGPAGDVGADDTGADVPLSPRERQVLSLLAVGRTNREIADELFLSVNTIRNHVAAVLAKLGARSRVEATAIAHRRRLVGDDVVS
jgi:DNA-binding NarL/FixJ family response regulator